MKEKNAAIQIKIRREFSVYELLNKYAFNDGYDVLPEEKPLIKAACNKLVQALGVIDNRWKPMVFETGHSPYYVAFQELLADQEQYNHYDALSVRERRYLDAVIEARIPGWHIVIADNELHQPSTEELPMTQTNPALDDVWRLFQETDRKFQETDRRFQETERLMKESSLETDRKFKETDQKIKELKDLFTSQWGRLMEALVEGDLVPLLIQRGIPVSDTSTRLKGKCPDGGNYEFDILAHNGIEMVVVEVKTTLRPDDVKHFLYKLDHMKGWIPRYAQNRIYGAVAWLTADAGAEIMAENRGLLSIRATGDSASIVNAATFRPRTW